MGFFKDRVARDFIRGPLKDAGESIVHESDNGANEITVQGVFQHRPGREDQASGGVEFTQTATIQFLAATTTDRGTEYTGINPECLSAFARFRRPEDASSWQIVGHPQNVYGVVTCTVSRFNRKTVGRV